MNVPNLLTLSRLAAVPILIVLMEVSFPGHDQWVAGVFALAALTDTVDGNLARSRDQVTELGKFLDPLADKLFVVSVLIVLVEQGRLWAWIVIVIFARELLITVLRSLSADQGHTISASRLGKAKTVTQIAAVLALILEAPYPVLHAPAVVLVAASLVFTVWSGVDYVLRFRGVWLAATPAILGDEAQISDLAGQVGAALLARGLLVGVAESCTGGLLGGAITAVPGSSRWFKGGILAYSNAVKMERLGVRAATLAEHGAVSEETAREMAEGLRASLGCDLALSVTGIAGPASDATEKPVGLTYIGLSDREATRVERHVFGLDRQGNRALAVRAALELLARGLKLT